MHSSLHQKLKIITYTKCKIIMISAILRNGQNVCSLSEPKNYLYIIFEVHKMDIHFAKSSITVCGCDLYIYINNMMVISHVRVIFLIGNDCGPCHMFFFAENLVARHFLVTLLFVRYMSLWILLNVEMCTNRLYYFCSPCRKCIKPLRSR